MHANDLTDHAPLDKVSNIPWGITSTQEDKIGRDLSIADQQGRNGGASTG
jgi:hypothetical protein